MNARARFFQVDVFPASPGGGNPLGVVLDAHDWPDARMQAFARWTGLVETTFVLPPQSERASYRVRIFTPAQEIPFAGHPSIGTAHVALESGVAARTAELVQECGAGLVPIRIDPAPADDLFLRAPGASVLREGEEAVRELVQALGDRAPGALAPALVEGGRRWWLAEIASPAALREWRPDHAAIGALAARSGALGLCAFARDGEARDSLVVRAFPAGAGIVEDPASGAANGLLAQYIKLREPQGLLARGYRVSQGREMGHDARIVVRYDADGVWVGGRARTVVIGEARWSLA